MLYALLFLFGDSVNYKSKYLSSAFLLLVTSVIVKVIGAVYKIPLTSFIGAVGRGYFATAYNLCLPIHAITMGAFPIAISRLVSQYNAVGDTKMVFALKRASSRLMLIVGLVGMGIMLVLAIPYSKYVAGAPKSIYTILILAPSVLFSSMAASYRGYYEGFMNMLPTSISQTLEALIKLVFGLIFSRLAMVYLFDYFSSKGTPDDKILSLAYPFTSAAAMLGVTFGSFVSLAFVWLYYLINKAPKPSDTVDTRLANRELLSFSFPIMISTAVQSFFQFLDTATVQYSLGNIPIDILKERYSSALTVANIADKDVTTYVYGLLSSSLDFKNLIPGVTMALGVCAVPAVSSAVHLGDNDRVKSLVNSIYKYTSILSFAGGMTLAIFSEDILSLFYGAGSDIVLGSKSLVSAFALTVPVYSLAGIAVFVVQALGKPEKSIAPYVVSGIIRVGLNVYLVSQHNLILMGAVISGIVGYTVLFVWNALISRIKMDILLVIIKPLFISLLSYLCIYSLFLHIIFSFGAIINLIVKLSLFVIIYCILCILCGMLNFRQIFCAIKPLKFA